ncbi:hypothetical protein DPMN_024895 [Dreissena polymorpha]|uniref:Uncharacterized protein n=1 Tax=Dreissena polymorpha TaxID=45954 RepID=A0A9D4LS90_DREPO|nr:hypothetical protein DPMN_024895 [Dreissena polymorpha]
MMVQCLVLRAKNQLKRSEQYSNVFKHKDQSVEERTLNKNLKTIVNVLKEKGCDISLKGTRVIIHAHHNSADGNSGRRLAPTNRNCENDYERYAYIVPQITPIKISARCIVSRMLVIDANYMVDVARATCLLRRRNKEASGIDMIKSEVLKIMLHY